MKTSRGVSAAQVRSTRTASAHERIGARTKVAINRDRHLNRANTLRGSRAEAARLRSARSAKANVGVGARGKMAVNRGRNVILGSNVAANRGRNIGVVNNWRSDRFRGQNYVVFRDYRRQWHDRTWWTNHYSRVIFVSGGWWYWNAGYWYPAWGYDPYAYYPYDGPIYGYGDLRPDQIIINVQIQLRRDGYYAGPTDGILGPQTRQALAAFQADHGLAITSTVDRPTLATLGLT